MKKTTCLTAAFNSLFAAFFLSGLFYAACAKAQESAAAEALNERLLQAVSENNLTAAEQAIKEGADVNFVNEEGRSLLEIAVWGGINERMKLYRELMKKNSRASKAQIRFNMTPSLIYVKTAALLLENGADPNRKSRGGVKLLYNIADSLVDYPEMAELFYMHGADSAKTRYGSSAWDAALVRRHIGTVEVFAKYGFAVNDKLRRGTYPLYEVIKWRSFLLPSDEPFADTKKKLLEIAEALIKHADVNSDNKGQTPLFLAEENGDKEMIALLKEKRAVSRPSRKELKKEGALEN